MRYLKAVLALALGSIASPGGVLADDPAPAEAAATAELAITMRIIEDPDAIAAEAITRRLELPLPRAGRDAAPSGGPAEGAGPGGAGEGNGNGKGKGKEFGAEMSERARDLAEQAGEQREEFGRSKAEEMRPDRPEIDPPRPLRP